MQPVLERTYTRPRIVPEPVVKNGIPKVFRWSVNEYHQIAELGFFNGKRVELIRGEIIEMAPMKSPHATSIQLAYDVLTKIFQEEFVVRQQLPLSLGKSNEPEPALAVVDGSIRDYSDAHPKTARLVVEVSDSSLRFYRNEKAELYAEHNIEEYWIVNLKQRCIEVYRRPVKDKNLGYAYTEISVFGETESVSPLAKPKGKINVIDILP